MSASEIIDEIKHLPSAERDAVITFVQSLPRKRQLSPEELGELAKKMAETDDKAEAERLKEQFIAGFYGD